MLIGRRNRITILAATLVFMVIGFTTCNTQDVTTDASNERLAKILSIYNEQKYELIDEVYSDSVVLHHSSFPEDIIGKAGVLNFIKSNAIAFPDMKLTMDKFYMSENIRFSFWEAEGTNTGILNDMPPTGNRMKIWGIAADRVVDGKIVEEWIVFNAMDIMNQLNPPVTPEEESTK